MEPHLCDCVKMGRIASQLFDDPDSELYDFAVDRRHGRAEDRETRQAVEDADKTEGKDRDLVHGDGGTLGLGKPEDLSHDD
jgi:hypothetical protein